MSVPDFDSIVVSQDVMDIMTKLLDVTRSSVLSLTAVKVLPSRWTPRDIMLLIKDGRVVAVVRIEDVQEGVDHV